MERFLEAAALFLLFQCMRGCLLVEDISIVLVLYCLPQLVRSLRLGNYAMSPVIAQRLPGDALRPMPNNRVQSKTREEFVEN
jgi:hypothetical protein